MSAVPQEPLAVAVPSTGVELMEAIGAGTIDPPPAAKLFGLEVLEVAEGRMVFGFRPDERFGNWTTTHGGVLAGLTDFAVTTAVITAVPVGTAVVTTNLAVTYLRAVPLDAGMVRVEGELVHVGRTLAHAEATIRDPRDGRMFVRATASCFLRAPA